MKTTDLVPALRHIGTHIALRDGTLKAAAAAVVTLRAAGFVASNGFRDGSSVVFRHSSGRLNIEFDDTNINFHAFDSRGCLEWSVKTTGSTPEAVLNAAIAAAL